MKIIYSNPSGNMSIVVPAPNYLAEIEKAKLRALPKDEVVTDEALALIRSEVLTGLALKDVPNGLPYEIVEDSAVPSDRSFRGAWEKSGATIVTSMPKAKEITKERLRAERTPLMEAQDVAFIRAHETGADTTSIVSEKQRLRDLPSLADQAQTLDDLKAIKASG